MPRSEASNIKKNIYSMIIDPLLNVFKKFGEANLNLESYNQMCDLITSCREGLKNFETEHKVIQNLKSMNLLKDLNEVVINKSIQPFRKNANLIYAPKIDTGIVTPLDFYFTKIFEKENVLQNTLSNIEKMKKSTKLTNFVNGQLYKEKEALYPDKVIIPYFLYFDDVEINNALGSHPTVHGVCNIYVSFPCLPMKESKLQNVFLAGIFKSQHVKTHGNEKCFMPLINLLRDLEVNGLLIKCKDEIHEVHFVLGLVAGDNLGVNCVLNFSRSFSSNYYCRFCKGSKSLCQQMCVGNVQLLRTFENYKKDVSSNNSLLTGVNSDSIFNKIPSFHVTKNFYVDTMHDLFEGVCHYDFSHILIHCIQTMKYFDLATLNCRKKNFNYGPNDIGNVSGPINLANITKKRFKMSASEMLTFTMYFPLMVGDLVPHDDEVWQFLLCLCEIIDIVLSYEISEELILILSQRIKQHNSEYIRLFHDSLKP